MFLQPQLVLQLLAATGCVTQMAANEDISVYEERKIREAYIDVLKTFEAVEDERKISCLSEMRHAEDGFVNRGGYTNIANWDSYKVFHSQADQDSWNHKLFKLGQAFDNCSNPIEFETTARYSGHGDSTFKYSHPYVFMVNPVSQGYDSRKRQQNFTFAIEPKLQDLLESTANKLHDLDNKVERKELLDESKEKLATGQDFAYFIVKYGWTQPSRHQWPMAKNGLSCVVEKKNGFLVYYLYTLCVITCRNCKRS
ncbi:hypothetical protein L596_013085 [Steinernema carpocapsae]|uniref:Uncharacterized protein n=1 Tax=Steinernema carpocapsae TaxID=34508 RepID=A0A4U5NZY6_STECR|nr:hypothetical protein L596_013085 [Steinernema carpocapsae]